MSHKLESVNNSEQSVSNEIENACQNQRASQKLVQNKQETSTVGNEKEPLDGKNPIKEHEKSRGGIKSLSTRREIRSTEHDVAVIKEQGKSLIPNQAIMEVDRANVKPSEPLEKVTPTVDDNPMFVSISVGAFNHLNCNYGISNILSPCLLFLIMSLIYILDHGHIR